MHTQKTSETQRVAAATSVVDDAVGVAESGNWFVAIVNHNAEVTSAKKLSAAGYEAFAATQRETRVWSNGRRHQVNRVVIGSVVFVCCTESERREIVNLPFISRFLPDRANGKPVAIIPDTQIKMLRFMLGNSESPVEFIEREYCVGERVRVARGRLVNCEGAIVRLPNGRGELVIALGTLGGAKCAIPLADIEPLMQ